MPEYQDAQRFMQTVSSATGLAYGPIAQSLSNPALAEFKTSADFNAGFVNVAVVYVWSDTLPMGEPYKAMMLTTGINCIYLKHADPASWAAKVVLARNYRCDATSAEVQAAPAVPVVAEDSSEAPGAIPPVTRFVQGSDKAAFLGVRCGALWCDVGAPNKEAIPASILHGLTGIPSDIADSPQLRVKGWFDEQEVGDGDARLAPPIRPRVFAAVVPLPGLRSLSTRLFQAQFQKVARVYMTDSVDKYFKRFGFNKGWSLIELSGSPYSTMWLARVTDSRGNVRTNFVDWTKHTIGSLPGTARWDWMDSDEWIWISCDVGCCLVREGDS